MPWIHWVEAPDEEKPLSEEELARIEWDKKHPRCSECGQFTGGSPHHVQDYFGEWDHI